MEKGCMVWLRGGTQNLWKNVSLFYFTDHIIYEWKSLNIYSALISHFITRNVLMSIQVLAEKNAVSSDMKDASGHNNELDMDLTAN